MWKSGNGLRKIVILSLLLVLAVGSLNAWSFGSKKESKSPEETPAQTQLEQSLLAELQTELDALKQTISNSQETIAKQAAELDALKASSTVSAINHDTLKGEYDALLAKYEALVNQPTVKDYVSPWGGIVGAGATYAPTTGRIGAEAEMGVSYKNVTLKTGVEWSPLKFEFVIPKMDDLKFKAGIQYRF